jgi:hypothetical protein
MKKFIVPLVILVIVAGSLIGPFTPKVEAYVPWDAIRQMYLNAAYYGCMDECTVLGDGMVNACHDKCVYEVYGIL